MLPAYILDMLELRRKLVHLLFGNAVFALVWFLPSPIYLLSLFLLVSLAVSWVYKAYKPKLLDKLLSKFDRQEDLKSQFPAKGAVQFFLGCIMAILLFSKVNASLGILALAWGDSFSTIVGLYLGKWKYKLGSSIKTIEGSAACFLASLLPLLFFLSPAKAILAAIAATIIEAFAFLNDNLLIPVAVAAVLTLLG